jgi:hypothetical protein
VAGALVGLWIAYALVRLLADRGRGNSTGVERLAHLWLAYADAAGRSGAPRPGLLGVECAVAIALLAVAVGWALVVGPDQAG